MSRLPKDPSRRQRSNTPAPPEAPQGLRVDVDGIEVTWRFDTTRRAWLAFWASPLALYVIEPDLPQLINLFELYDERAALRKTVVRGFKTVKGSTGQRVRHPIYDRIKEVGTEIEKLEDRYFISPKGRRAGNIDLTTVPKHDADGKPALRAIN